MITRCTIGLIRVARATFIGLLIGAVAATGGNILGGTPAVTLSIFIAGVAIGGALVWADTDLPSKWPRKTVCGDPNAPDAVGPRYVWRPLRCLDFLRRG